MTTIRSPARRRTVSGVFTPRPTGWNNVGDATSFPPGTLDATPVLKPAVCGPADRGGSSIHAPAGHELPRAPISRPDGPASEALGHANRLQLGRSPTQRPRRRRAPNQAASKVPSRLREQRLREKELGIARRDRWTAIGCREMRHGSARPDGT